MVLKGSTTGSITSTAYKIPCTIKSIALYNRTAGAIVVNIGVVAAGVETYFKTVSLAANASEYTETYIRVLGDWQIIVASAGSIYYYLTLE